MEKIKSARELAMERTGDLKMIKDIAGATSESEHEPYLKASSLLAGSFLNQDTDLEKVVSTINRYPGEARVKAIGIFLKEIITGMNLNNSKNVAAACRHYCTRMENSPIKAVESIGDTFQGEVEKLQVRVEKGKQGNQTLERLHREGVGGSAVAGANLERSPWWKEQLANLAASFAPELENLKKQLLESLDRS